MLREEPDDEVAMFDRTTLLGSDSREGRKRRSPLFVKRLNTFALCGAFFSVGLALAIPGPTLNYLRCNVGVSLQAISYIFPARSLGYLIGSVIAGFLFDRFVHKDKLLVSLYLVLAAISIGAAPWASSLTTLCVLLSITSLAMGALDTGGNVICLRIWEKESGPYMQALHFAFGLGACIAPLVAAPFLSATGLSCNVTMGLQSTTEGTAAAAHLGAEIVHKRRAYLPPLITNPAASHAQNENRNIAETPVLYDSNTTITISPAASTSPAATTSPAITTIRQVATTLPPRKPETGVEIQKNKDLDDANRIDVEKLEVYEKSGVKSKLPALPDKPVDVSNSSHVGSSNISASDKGSSADNHTSVTTAAAMLSSTTAGTPSTAASQTNPPGYPSAAAASLVVTSEYNTTKSSEDTTATTTLTAASAEITTVEITTNTEVTPFSTSETTPPVAEATHTTTAPPTSTIAPPTSTTVPPTSTIAPPTSTTVPPTSTTAQPTSTTVPPTSTTAPCTSTIAPPTSTTAPPTSSIASPVRTKIPPTIATAPPTSTTGSPTSTIAPLTSATAPPISTTAPPTIRAVTAGTASAVSLHENSTTNTTNDAADDNRSILEKAHDFFKSISSVQFSYVVIAASMFTFGFIFCCLDSRSCSADRHSPSKRQKSEADLHDVAETMMAPPLSYKLKVMTAVFVFFFLYVGTEVSYGQFIATFGIHHSDLSERNAAYLTSVYWGMFAVARGCSIPLSRCLTPSTMLIGSITLTLSSSIGLMLATVVANSTSSLWILSATLGAGMAAIFPTGVLWLEGYLKVTSKMAAVFVSASALGEMIIPAIVGYSIERSGPLTLIYVTLVCTIGCALTFIVMSCLVNTKTSEYRPLTHSHRRSNGMQMQEFEFSDTDSEETDPEPILKGNGYAKLN